jgi:hypothetical protein
MTSGGAMPPIAGAVTRDTTAATLSRWYSGTWWYWWAVSMPSGGALPRISDVVVVPVVDELLTVVRRPPPLLLGVVAWPDVARDPFGSQSCRTTCF